MAAKKAAKPTAAQRLAKLKRRARVISVYGAFNSRALIEVPTELASDLVGKPLEQAGTLNVIEAVEHDLAALRERDAELADSSLAATAVQLAYELQNPFNSATSKSMCARSLIDTIDRLFELAPPEKERDGVDDLTTRRAARLAARSAAAKG